MDPGVLFGSADTIEQRVVETIEKGRGQRHIMNLGHGVMVGSLHLCCIVLSLELAATCTWWAASCSRIAGTTADADSGLHLPTGRHARGVGRQVLPDRPRLPLLGVGDRQGCCCAAAYQRPCYISEPTDSNAVSCALRTEPSSSAAHQIAPPPAV